MDWPDYEPMFFIFSPSNNKKGAAQVPFLPSNKTNEVRTRT